MHILIFAPHRDDEIIGVGGTILKHKAAGDTVSVCLVTAREGEVLPDVTMRIHREMQACHAFCGVDNYFGLPFGANLMETYSRKERNAAFLDVLKKAQPDEVYVPHWGDMQLDHRITTETAMVALRPKYGNNVKRIYAYETLSETGLNTPTAENAFIPNVYEDISDFLDRKLEAMRFYQSQLHPFPDLRSEESITALARFRGAAVNVKAAEAFMLIREIR